MGGVFKAYDIRGIHGETLTEELVTHVGRALVTFLGCKTVTVGRDMRPHSLPLFHALAEGLTRQGAHVIDLGLCSTPMAYFGNGRLGADAGVMITASHNPGKWNGMKLTRAQAVPISGATGIADLERIVAEAAYDPPAAAPGTVSQHDIAGEYAAHIRRHADLARPVRIAADMANAMGIVEAAVLNDIMQVDVLYGELDGSFPNHEANPLRTETLAALQQMVREGTYDFAVAFDGDADRVGFVDEQGGIIPMDSTTALIAREILSREKGTILYDLRSSRAVGEIIAESGGTPIMSRVGHAFIKQQMRDHNALFAGELSGHYYFRENYFTESSSLAVIHVANIVSRSDKPLSELVRPLQRYFSSGEINSTVEDPPAILAALRSRYADGRLVELDGLTVAYDDWWFNVRASNTEPLVRLIVEADTPELVAEKGDELTALIRGRRR